MLVLESVLPEWMGDENSVIENVKGEITIILNLIKDIIMKIEGNKNYEVINVISNISYQLKTSLLDLN